MGLRTDQKSELCVSISAQPQTQTHRCIVGLETVKQTVGLASQLHKDRIIPYGEIKHPLLLKETEKET